MNRLERLLMWRPFSTMARTLIILALVVPLLFSGLFMWAMWDPTGSVPQTRLAVVNEDKGVDRGEGAGLEKFGEESPMKRPGQPAELAGAYVNLAAAESSYTTGQVYGVTGGAGFP